MTKNESLTGYHVKVMMWVFGGLISFFAIVLIGLVAYIWQDSKKRQEDFNLNLQNTLKKHEYEITEVKKCLLLQGIDIDKRVESEQLKDLLKEMDKKHNPRGGKQSTQPLYNYSSDINAIYVASD